MTEFYLYQEIITNTTSVSGGALGLLLALQLYSATVITELRKGNLKQPFHLHFSMFLEVFHFINILALELQNMFSHQYNHI